MTITEFETLRPGSVVEYRVGSSEWKRAVVRAAWLQWGSEPVVELLWGRLSVTIPAPRFGSVRLV